MPLPSAVPSTLLYVGIDGSYCRSLVHPAGSTWAWAAGAATKNAAASASAPIRREFIS